MEGTKSWGAMFATKGIEYLLVIGYMAMFIPFAILLHRLAQGRAPLPQPEAALPGEGVPGFSCRRVFFCTAATPGHFPKRAAFSRLAWTISPAA